MNGNIVKLKDYRHGIADETGRREKPKIRRWPTIRRTAWKGAKLVFRLLAASAMFALFFILALLRGPIKVALSLIALSGLAGGVGLILTVPEMRIDQQRLSWYWYDLFLCWIDLVFWRYR